MAKEIVKLGGGLEDEDERKRIALIRAEAKAKHAQKLSEMGEPVARPGEPAAELTDTGLGEE